jgi:predicted flap endonuclease-1-like 5' DNA nuclease
MSHLTDIECIGEVYDAKLVAAGMKSVEHLLESCSSKKARIVLAEQTGISEKLILAWVNKADLCRIKGISTQYADLLEHAGVDSVPELAQRKAENLQAKMAEVNEQKNLVKKVPALSQVEDWVAQAKALPAVVSH